MESTTQIILSFLGLIGIGVIITAKGNKRKDRQFQEFEQKQCRFGPMLLYMDSYFQSENIQHLASRQPDILSPRDILEHLKAENHQMILDSSKDVILKSKEFIRNPIRDNFMRAILKMRPDLWISRSDLDKEELQPSIKLKN